MAKSIFKDVVKYIIVFFVFYLLSVAYVKNDLKIFALGFAGSLMLLAKDSFVFAIVFVVANFLATFSFVEVLSICPLNWRTNNVDTFARLQQMEEYFEVKEFLNSLK